MRFSKPYLVATALIVGVELFIALAMHDDFVRPYVGDTLAVALVYAALLGVLSIRRRTAALVALAVAYAVELGQGFQLVERLGLGELTIARVVLGTYCDPRDVVAYTAALPLIGLTEHAARAQRAFRSLFRFRETRRPRLESDAAP